MHQWRTPRLQATEASADFAAPAMHPRASGAFTGVSTFSAGWPYAPGCRQASAPMHGNNALRNALRGEGPPKAAWTRCRCGCRAGCGPGRRASQLAKNRPLVPLRDRCSTELSSTSDNAPLSARYRYDSVYPPPWRTLQAWPPDQPQSARSAHRTRRSHAGTNGSGSNVRTEAWSSSYIALRDMRIHRQIFLSPASSHIFMQGIPLTSEPARGLEMRALQIRAR